MYLYLYLSIYSFICIYIYHMKPILHSGSQERKKGEMHHCLVAECVCLMHPLAGENRSWMVQVQSNMQPWDVVPLVAILLEFPATSLITRGSVHHITSDSPPWGSTPNTLLALVSSAPGTLARHLFWRFQASLSEMAIWPLIYFGGFVSTSPYCSNGMPWIWGNWALPEPSGHIPRGRLQASSATSTTWRGPGRAGSGGADQPKSPANGGEWLQCKVAGGGVFWTEGLDTAWSQLNKLLVGSFNPSEKY